MNAKVAVVTDAITDEFFFPLWYKYYSTAFGGENLFVVTYRGSPTSFLGYSLGGIIRLPVLYSDQVRRGVISNLVATLLETYDTVVRVDTDEILVTDTSSAPPLADYVKSLERPYLAARGFDVVQLPDEDPLGNARTGILARRMVAYPNTALNKTCIVRTPVNWTSGFHWCSTYPVFGPLFMLHLKRVDINWQLEWCTRMSESTADPNLAEYYRADRKKIIDYHQGLSNRPVLGGIANFYRHDHLTQYLNSITFRPREAMYVGSYGHELVLCQIPDMWKQIL